MPLTLGWIELTTNSTAAGAQLRGILARLENPKFEVRGGTWWRDGAVWVLPPARGRPFVATVSGRWTRWGHPMLLFVHRYLDEMHDSNPRTGRARGITRLALESPLYAAFVRRYSFLVALFAATTKRWRGGER